MKLKKALSLSLALVLSLAMAVPAFAAPLSVPTPYTGLQVTLSDVTAEGTATVHGSWSGTVDLKIYTVPVGSSITIDSYCDKSISKCVQGADGVYTSGDTVYRGYSGDNATIVWDETYANAVWWVSVWQIDSDGFLVKVDSGSTPTQPEKPAEPEKPVEPAKPAGVKTANPTNDKLMVNGAEKAPTVYKIGGSNYFKIRDVAAVLNGTEKQFAVGYSGGKVTVTSGQPYEATGKELAGPPSGAKDAAPSNDSIVIDGTEASLTVYKIGGSNYFKLRDLGEALDFHVGYSGGKVTIETDKPYSK